VRAFASSEKSEGADLELGTNIGVSTINPSQSGPLPDHTIPDTEFTDWEDILQLDTRHMEGDVWMAGDRDVLSWW
jgi:hypothetical protein